VLREAAVRRLLGLRAAGELTTEHVRLAARSLGAGERSVWRWVDLAASGQRLARRRQPTAVLDEELRRRLAYCRGNVAAVHRELVGRRGGRWTGGAEPGPPCTGRWHGR
jgi:putative transposase